jgi:hypothetical protein
LKAGEIEENGILYVVQIPGFKNVIYKIPVLTHMNYLFNYNIYISMSKTYLQYAEKFAEVYPDNDVRFKEIINNIQYAYTLFTTENKMMYTKIKRTKQEDMNEYVGSLQNNMYGYADGISSFYIIKKDDNYILVLQNDEPSLRGYKNKTIKIDTSFGYKYRYLFKLPFFTTAYLPWTFQILTSSFSKNVEKNAKILVLLDLIKKFIDLKVDNVVYNTYNKKIIIDAIKEYVENQNIDVFYNKFLKIFGDRVNINSLRTGIILDGVSLGNVAREDQEVYDGEIIENDEGKNDEDENDEDENDEDKIDEDENDEGKIDELRLAEKIKGGKHKTNKRRKHKTNKRRKHKTNKRRMHKTNKHHRRW